MAQPRRNLRLTVEILRRLAAPSGPDWTDLEADFGAEVFQWHLRDLDAVEFITGFKTSNIIADGPVEFVASEATDAGLRFLQDVEQPHVLEKLSAQEASREVTVPLDLVAASIPLGEQQE